MSRGEEPVETIVERYAALAAEVPVTLGVAVVAGKATMAAR
jgi:hypothetical protein